MVNSLSVHLRGIFQNKNEESWWARVKENARAFFELRGAKACAAGGAFELLEAEPSPGTRQRQAASILVHAVVIGILLVLGRGAMIQQRPFPPGLGPGPSLSAPPPFWRAENPGRGNGAGGHQDPLPPGGGDFARLSRTVLLHPRVPDQMEHPLVVEPTVFDPNADDRRHVTELGLPWMKDRNRSNGPGKLGGIGTTDGNTMGTNDGNEEGESAYDGPPVPGMTQVKCLYCPDPEYTDEARHEKLQGSVTLRMLVTKDGRAVQVKVVKGLGLGLDERAIAAVRTWKFQPARDANKNAIAEWVTVEATYRLF